MYRPEEVARAILYAATHVKRDIYVGSGARAMSLMNRTLPRAMDRVGSTVMMRGQVRSEPPREPEGALHRPGVGGRVRGDHPGHVMRTSFYTQASLHPVLTGAIIGVASAAAAALISSRNRHERSLPRGLD